MTEQRVNYIIDLIASDKKLRQQMSKWDWEDIMGLDGKGFGDIIIDGAKVTKDELRKILGGLNIDWSKALGTKEIGQLEQAVTRALSNSRKELEAFASKGDTTGIENTIKYVSALGDELTALGSSFDAKALARGMGAFMKVLAPLAAKLDTLADAPKKVEVAFDRLFSTHTINGVTRANNAVDKIAKALVSLGTDKAAIANIRQIKSELEKAVQTTKIELEIDYSKLSDKEIEKQLRKKLNISDTSIDLEGLLTTEWDNQLVALEKMQAYLETLSGDTAKYATESAKLIPILKTILSLGEKGGKLSGYSWFEGFAVSDYADKNEIKDEVNEIIETLNKELDKSKKKLETATESLLSGLGKVDIKLTLGEADKTQFKNSINTFIEDLNAQKYGDIKPVKIDLDLNEPEKTTKKGRPRTASKEQIEATKSDIQKALDEAKKEYAKVDDVLNNAETGLNKKLADDPKNGRLAESIKRAQEELTALEKSITSYSYLLSHMDDYDFAKSVVSDWKKFSSAAQNIRISQDKLLTDTRKWRNEMNDALKFRYQWTVEGAEDEFDRLSWALTDISERKPIQLMPDIDFMVNAIEEGLAGREINVKLAADGPIKATGGVVGNLGVVPIVASSKQVPQATHATAVPQTQNPPSQIKELEQQTSEQHTYIDTAINSIIQFVERHVDAATELKVLYAELLKDAGITDKQVADYIKNVRDGKTTVPAEIVSKYGTADTFLSKLRKTKTQVNFNEKLPFLNIAPDILRLKDVIANNPEDSEEVKKASEQIKTLLIQSVVDSFVAYNKQSHERFSKNEKEIKEWEQSKVDAINAYGSDAEKKKRLDKITAQKQKISTIEANTAISEYELLLELIDEAKKIGDTDSLNSFLEQERKTSPAVKQGYQDLIDAREQLKKLYQEDPNDKNLLKVVEAEQKIASLTRSNQKIARSRQEYEAIGFPLQKLENLINAKDSDGVYDVIVDEILSKSNIVQSMGAKRKTSDAISPIYLFDTTHQKLMTATIDMVQKALSITQQATAELDRRAMNEGLLGDLKKTANKKRLLSIVLDASSVLPQETFEQIKDVFAEDLARASQINEYTSLLKEISAAKKSKDTNLLNELQKKKEETPKDIRDAHKSITSGTNKRDMAYVKFANALNEATQAADAFRGLYASWSDEDKLALMQAPDEQEWFKTKYSNIDEANQKYAIYTRNKNALKVLQDSVLSKTNKETGESEQYGISKEITDQLKGYVFRVTLVDDKGTHTVGVGTDKLVKEGRLAKPDISYQFGKNPMAKFLAMLPEDLSEIPNIEFYRAPGVKSSLDKPSNIEIPTLPGTVKKDNSRVVAEAKQVIARANRAVDAGANTVTAQEELATANEALQAAEQVLQNVNDNINKITGGIDLKEYKNNLLQQRSTLTSLGTNGAQADADKIMPLSNKVFDDANEIIENATKEADLAKQIAQNPLDTKLHKLFKGNLPDSFKRLSEVVQKQHDLNNVLPSSQEEAVAIQAKIQELKNEEKVIRDSIEQWSNTIGVQSDSAIKSANQTKEQEAPKLAGQYQKKLVGLVDQAMSLSQQLEADPNNEELKTQMQGIVDTISQLVVYYKVLLEKYNITTKGFLGNENERKYQHALQIYKNPGDKNLLSSMELWGGFDKIPEAVYKREELQQRDSELMRLIPTLPEDQRKVMEAERKNIAAEYNKENQKVLQWVNRQKDSIGTGLLAGLGNSGKKFKTVQGLMSNWKPSDGSSEAPKVDARYEILKIGEEISTINALDKQRETQEQIVATAKERLAIAKRQVEIEQELADTNITTERKAELETELANNRNRAMELGAKTKKFATTSVDSEELQSAYLEVISDLINQQEESDKKISQLKSEIERDKARVGKLEAERTEEAVTGGRRKTQDRAINSHITTLAEDFVNEGIVALQERDRLKALITHLETKLSNVQSANGQNVDGYQERWNASQLEAHIKTHPFAQQDGFDFETWLFDSYDQITEKLKLFSANPNDLSKLKDLKQLVVISRALEELTGQEWLKPFVTKNSAVFRGETQNPYAAIESFVQTATERQEAQRAEIVEEINSARSQLERTHAPRGFEKIYRDVYDEHPITDYYDYPNPAERQQRKIKEDLKQKAEDYVREHMTSEEQQKAINQAIMAQKNAIAEKEARLQAEREHNKAITAERDRLKVEGQVTDEMIAARKNVTEEIRQEAKIIHKSGDVVDGTFTDITPQSEEQHVVADTHYQNYVGAQYASGGVYNLNVSDLAKDATLHTTNETLNSIYALLSGDTSRTGLSDAERRALEAERETIRNQLGGDLGRNNGLTDDLRMAEEAEAAAKILHNALSQIDVRHSSIDSLIYAYKSFGQEVFDAEQLLKDPNYQGPLEIAQLASLGLEEFPDTDELLARLKYMRVKVGHDTIADIDAKRVSADSQSQPDVQTHLYNQFADWLRQIAKEVFNITDLPIDKFADTIRNIWIPQALKGNATDISQLMMDRTSGQYLIENRLGIKAPEPEVIPEPVAEETAKSIMTIGRAIAIINKAIGGSTAKTATGMANAYANKIHDNDEAVKAAKLLYNTPDSEFTSKFGLETKKKLVDFRDAWAKKQENEKERHKAMQDLEKKQWDAKQKVPVKPEIAPGAVAEEVKENVAETPARAEVEQVVDDNVFNKSTIDGFRLMSKLKQQYASSNSFNRAGNVTVFDDDSIHNLLASFGSTGLRGKQTLSKQGVTAQDIIQSLPSHLHSEGIVRAFNFLQNDAFKLGDIFVDFYNEVITYKEAFERIQSIVNKRMVQLAQQTTESQKQVETVVDSKATNDIIHTLLPDGSPFEGTEQQLREELERFVGSAEEVATASEQQLQNERAKTEETTEQLTNDRSETAESESRLDNIEALKAREEEINAKLLADDKLRATQSADNTSSGGIIGAMNELAKDSTLHEILRAIGEIAKRQVSSVSGKGNSAQDLLMRLQKMLQIGVDQKRERVAYIDLATGSMTDSIEGTNEIVSKATIDALRNAYSDAINFNAQVHTHADEDDPYFSPKDLEQFAQVSDSIKKQILLSKNGMTVLDMENVSDVKGLLDALIKTEHNFEALAATAERFGATYINSSFNEITPQGLVKLLGIKGIESKYTETETRDSAIGGVLAEEVKEAAKVVQESTGRAIKTTIERYGAEKLITTEKTDAKGNKVWSKQYDDSYTKAMKSVKKDIDAQDLASQFGEGTKAAKALEEYTALYENLTAKVQQFNQSTSDEEKNTLQQEINELIPTFNKAEKEIVNLIARKEQFLRVGIKLDNILSQEQINRSSLEDIATQALLKDGVAAGQNIATVGTQSTKNGRQLLVDVLDAGAISRYGIEVDEVTGQVRQLALAEAGLANAFLTVNRAMKFDKDVRANVAPTGDIEQMQEFFAVASSPAWDAYKEALAEMQNYTAQLWNTKKAGGTISESELQYLDVLSERVITLGQNIKKTSIAFKDFQAQYPDNVFTGDSSNKDIRSKLENEARKYASRSNSAYEFANFDNNTLQFTLTDIEGRVSKVTYVWNELYQQIAMVSNKSTDALDPVVAKINKYDDALQQAVKDGYLMESDSNFDAFYKATDGIRFFVDGIKDGYETYDTSKEKLEELRQEALKYGEAAKKTITQNKRWFVGTGAKKQVDNQYNKIFGARQVSGGDFASQFADDSTLFKSYIDAYTQLNTKYKEYVANNTINNPQIQQQIQQQAAQVQILGKKYLASVTQAEQLKDLVDQSGYYTDTRTGEERDLGGSTGVTAEELTNLEAKMRDFVQGPNGLRQANIEGVKFDAVNQKLTYTFRTGKNTVADMVVQYNDATKALYAYQKQERESLTGFAGFMQSMQAKMKSILQYTTSITSIYRIWGELRRGIQYIREIDSALTELRKVTDETEETYDRFLQTAAKTADKVGSTIKEVVSSTADWARIGYNLKDAATLAESTAILLNVSEFQSIEDATSALTSTLQAFGYTADQSMNVVDVMNEVGKLVARR